MSSPLYITLREHACAVETAVFEAEAGDMVIVPPAAWDSFVNTGAGPLRQTAIHQSPRAVTRFEDGTGRD